MQQDRETVRDMPRHRRALDILLCRLILSGGTPDSTQTTLQVLQLNRLATAEPSKILDLTIRPTLITPIFMADCPFQREASESSQQNHFSSQIGNRKVSRMWEQPGLTKQHKLIENNQMLNFKLALVCEAERTNLSLPSRYNHTAYLTSP